MKWLTCPSPKLHPVGKWLIDQLQVPFTLKAGCTFVLPSKENDQLHRSPCS
jgi:hypothetical protein